MELPDLPILKLDFRLEAESPVVLPPFLGSTLRGAFGTALKQILCFASGGDCPRCPFLEVCPYQFIFETPNLILNEENHPKLRGQREVPQPFILIVPAPVKKPDAPAAAGSLRVKNFNDDYRPNYFAAGDALEFSILLIGGAAANYWGQITAAVRLMAENGLGEARVRFALSAAFAHDSNGQAVGVFDRRVSARDVSPIKLAWIAGLRADILEKNAVEKNILAINFLTPTRIRIADRIDTQIDFGNVLKKITDRLEFLVFLYGEPARRVDYRSLLNVEENFRPLETNLRKYSFEQYSNRQAGKTRREIFLGEIRFQAEDLKKKLRFLAAGELLNIGSNTSAGMGRFEINNQTGGVKQARL